MSYDVVGYGAIAAYLGKDGLAKLLGPTADYLGGELKDFAKKRIDNIGSIFANASNKLSHEKQGVGAVSPKVLRSVLNEGSYCSDELGIEYFGGILASSKSESGRDDRGARLALKASSLTSYQLRAHYILYSALIGCFRNEGLSISVDRHKLLTLIEMHSFMELMDFDNAEGEQIDAIFAHIFSGLSQEGLIQERYAYGHAAYLKGIDSRINDSGVTFLPTVGGVELFLWAFGLGDKWLDFMFDEAFDFAIDSIDLKTLIAEPIK
ncbi:MULTISPECIES: hypothetical protein [Enterobacter]|uniref:hypothetical protein n=1 Tax=Enterobacter TaxID=547 RepID=UPI001BD52D2D|nr:hypothetical protein [Enterobacter quasiroggenkampii]EHN8801681.1 hypothetical protein [Enterobacter asburiae]MCU6307532.1 hypothetical protein [Enterobacter quasiroggenkampii]MCU6401041.1 hypothetical protein [Enterobacter quasiroggenkampii]HCM9692522.1 hypothetical protein [Enterobacter asburiae]